MLYVYIFWVGKEKHLYRICVIVNQCRKTFIVCGKLKRPNKQNQKKKVENVQYSSLSLVRNPSF